MNQFMDDLLTSSVATIVSVCNYPIREVKVGISPNVFAIPAAPFGGVSVLHVEDGTFFIYVDSNRGSIRSITPSLRFAKSIVEDYCNAQLLKNSDQGPGLFYVPGALTAKEVEEKYGNLVKEARAQHTLWAKALIALADDNWNVNQKRSAVSDRSRDAANFLKLERPWISVIPVIAPVENIVFKSCPVCYENVHPEAIVCRSCKSVLNKKKYDELNKVSA